VTPRVLSVVAPAYNEEHRLPGLLEELVREPQGWLAPTGLVLGEILVVDDGSSDDTARVLAAAAGRDRRVRGIALSEHRGKGAAARAGVLATVGDYVLVTDVDLSTPLDELPKLFAQLRSGADAAIGSRAAAGAELGLRQRRSRELLGKTLNLALRISTGLSFRDTQCGFKLFRGEAARTLFGLQQIDGYLYDAELCVNARRLELATVEVPVRWSHHPDTRVRLLRSVPAICRDLVKLAQLARTPAGRVGPRAVGADPQADAIAGDGRPGSSA
jgi:dolichyl-phosphate beta-glucosyltransferase